MESRSFVRTRPMLYHLTAKSNVKSIQRTGMLFSAARLMTEGGMPQQRHVRRRHHLSAEVGGESVLIRDQAPLHAGNMSLLDGMSFGEFVALLNEHVFFWPGTDRKPIAYGLRHFMRYASEECSVLVIPTEALFDTNPTVPPLFSRFNSGSPRCNGGLPSPRGTRTFRPTGQFMGTPSRVVEVVFRGTVVLPDCGVKVRSPAQFLP